MMHFSGGARIGDHGRSEACRATIGDQILQFI